MSGLTTIEPRVSVAAQPGADVARVEVQAVQAAQQAAEQAVRIEAEAARARSEAAAAEQQAARAQGERVTVENQPDGRVRVTTPDGRTIEIDPNQIAHDALAGLTHAPPPGFRERPDPIPDGIIPLVGIIFGMIAATIIGLPIARAFARRMDSRSAVAPQSPDVAVRLDRIEQAIETIAVEVERVSEAQRYSAKLLTERLPESPGRAIAAEHVRG